MNIDLQTFEALKRIIFTLHKTPIKGINGLDFVKVRDWIDETEKEHEMDDYKMGGKKEIPL